MRLSRLVEAGVALVGTTAVAIGAIGSATAAPRQQPSVRTVPFEVSGELPIYPEALWSNGDEGPKVRNLEARLIQLKLLDPKYLDDSFGTMTRSAVKEFQRAHEIPPLGYVDQNTWDELKQSSHEPTRTELYPPPPKPIRFGNLKLDVRCSTGRAMCIDKTTRQLVWVVDGKPLTRMDVRFGAKATQTREGLFSVGWKSRHHVSKLYDSEMPYAMFFSGGQAVHYSSDFAARGYAGASHGCANIRDKAKIKWLFDQVRVGDKVVIYRS
jgi:L,D-transpeptidase catalytic domain/Putative peptidoglycan binding domain